MPKGKPDPIEIVNGWPMKKRKSLKTSEEDLYHCIHRTRTLGCHACFRVHRTNRTVTVVRHHSRHEQDEMENEREMARSDLRERAEYSEESAKSQINYIRNKYSSEAVMQVGDYNSLRKVINRARNEDPNRKEVDINMILAGKYVETSDGKPFLIKHMTVDSEPLLIFASEAGLNHLSQGNIIFVDGTFDCTPDGFCQLFTMHVYLSESVIRPVVFALLPSKRKVCYTTVIEELKKQPQLANWDPEMVISDFELNIQKAFREQFPSIRIHSCYFHLIQAWRRKMQKLKIYEDTFAGGVLHEFWKLLKALPFLQPVDIPDYFEEISESLPHGHTGKEFLAYVEKYYILGTTNSPPVFPKEHWTCNYVSRNSVHRTTNSLEVWHRTLSSVIHISNGLRALRLSDLIDKIKIEDMHTVLDGQMLAINRNHQVSFGKSNGSNSAICRYQAVAKQATC
ncbi:unnamed protein product [Caenorhabditis brenneri]